MSIIVKSSIAERRNERHGKMNPMEENMKDSGSKHYQTFYQDVSLQIVEPPQQVKSLHEHFIEELTSWFKKHQITLLESRATFDVPAIITVVNSSRVVSDIKRDLGRKKGDKMKLNIRKYFEHL